MATYLSRLSIIGFILFTVILISCSKEPEPEPQVPDPTEPKDNENQNEPRTYITEQHTIDGISFEIYLPSDYVEGARYPTLYFNDGDFFADVFGSLTSLEAESFIMVGLWDDNNRAARFSAYQDDELTNAYGTYTPSAEVYTKTLVDEVVPFVEGKYKSSKRALFGISLGGLHATWTGIKYPGVFTFVGALSPSYWVGGNALFNESLEALRPVGLSSQKIFYIDRGTAEWRNLMPLVEGLKQVELIYGQNIYYYEVLGADHDTPFWLLRIETPFRLFLEGPEELDEMELSGYCVNNFDDPGSKQARINPIISYNNGIKFSVMTEAQFQVVSGDGTVQPDGSYTINSGNSMTVACNYMGLTKQVQVSECN